MHLVGTWYHPKENVIRLCLTEPKAFARSNQFMTMFFLLRLASLIASASVAECSIQPAINGKNPFCVRSFRKPFTIKKDRRVSPTIAHKILFSTSKQAIGLN